ncbi:MAG: transporter substrate-binding domain-containing protein [Desulfobacula sp.]|nr:transporter substrate-binding domain-containing protein [Desulfobacula sp.]
MYKLASLIMLTVLTVCFNPAFSLSKELVIAFSYDIPPFVINKGTKGLEIDIVKEALKYKGHTFKIKQYSYKRLQIAVSKMGADGAAAVRKTEDGTFYSDDFIAFKNFAITKKKAKLTINSISELKGKNIFTWQNAYKDLGEEFKALFSPDVTAPYKKKYKEIPVQAKQVESFWKGRGDRVIVIDEAIFKWFSKQLSTRIDTSEELVYHKIFDTKTKFQVNFKKQQIRDDFNAGLKYIREKGQYQEIINRYR